MQEFIVHPDTHSRLKGTTEAYFEFEDGSRLPVHRGTPILFGKDSIFSAQDILNAKETTQDTRHLDTSNFKNYVRRKVLPALATDFGQDKRYENLSKKLPSGGRVLIVGAGEKIQYYKNLFPQCTVITSDVHDGFKPDFIIDGHFTPFVSECFDLVLAAQVIEHVMHPWKFCDELQRVTKIGGLLQIEAPQNYPYHAEPYDFFRFTFTGMRSLFPGCAVVQTDITEGNAAMVAVSISNYFINTSSKRIVRSSWLFVTRLAFGWMKYLDKLQPKPNRRTVSMPKGYAFTFVKDNISRKPAELLAEFYDLKK